jgi:type IV pilus assembly protein PilC
MPQFVYRAKSGPQETIEGKVEAENQNAALTKINQMGYFPLSIAKEERDDKIETKIPRLKSRGVKTKDLSLFTRQLSDLLETGSTLFAALKILERQTENERLRKVIQELHDDLRQGSKLSEAMKKHPKVFSPLYLSMVRSGEFGEVLEPVLRRLSDLLEKQDETRKKIRSALAYPALTVVVSLVTIIVLLVFIIPRLAVMFQEMGQILPLPTRVLIELSRFFTTYGWLAGLVLVLGLLLMRRQKLSDKLALRMDRLRLKLPLLGDLIKKLEIARFTRAFGTLLGNGVPILQSLSVVSQIVQNRAIRSHFQDINDQVAQGRKLGESLERSPYFPVMVTSMISVGEESNRLDRVLQKVADSYDEDVDGSIRIVVTLLEPVAILIMGSVVAFIVLSMMLPIFRIDIMVR